MRFTASFALYALVLCFLVNSVIAAPTLVDRAKAKGKGKATDPPAPLDKGKGKATDPPPPNPPPAGPANPPPRPATPDAAEAGCGKQTAAGCAKCVTVKGAGGKAVCGFTKEAPGACVGISTSAKNLLATSAGECKALESAAESSGAGDKELEKQAKAQFTKVKAHVFGTENAKSPTSGRHLASAFVKKNGKTFERETNDVTGLSKFSPGANSQAKKIKTTWDDDNGSYTAAQVQTICEKAIFNVLKLDKKLPVGINPVSTSVASGKAGVNICVGVSRDSVFPTSIEPTTVALGQKCNGDSGVADDA